MPYPSATEADRLFFREHGWIAVTGAVDPADLKPLIRMCDEILDNRDTMAFDWAWEQDESLDARVFRIVQASPTRHWPELNEASFRSWAVEFASELMGETMEFWYDQFLAKPPEESAPTYWHQDEAYWGRNLNDRGITCWMPFHDVNADNGCMHFVDRGHRQGVLLHEQPARISSDLLHCNVNETDSLACPLSLGDVTFHHGKTPHMTPENRSKSWRKVLTQHMKSNDAEGEGDHYPWKVYVNQFTGVRKKPVSR